jgi:hypothetical protein
MSTQTSLESSTVRHMSGMLPQKLAFDRAIVFLRIEIGELVRKRLEQFYDLGDPDSDDQRLCRNLADYASGGIDRQTLYPVWYYDMLVAQHDICRVLADDCSQYEPDPEDVAF